MAYFLDLFSPETYEAFLRSPMDVSGFRLRHQNAASKISPGDKLICYLTKLSRWVGILQILDTWFIDETPIFYETNDPFVVRFNVKPLVWLPIQHAIPIHDNTVWNTLTFTKNHTQNSYQWTGKVRSSLVRLDDRDGTFLEHEINNQIQQQHLYEFDERLYRRFAGHTIRRVDKAVTVSVPENSDTNVVLAGTEVAEVRESLKLQALIARIGAKMGLKVWVPRGDKAAVSKELKKDEIQFLDILPLNYDEITLRTIEQIDVLWLRGRSIVRAFEVEHTTSIYSGILRMADLLALQPNMDIKLHIVAPYSRREKVFQEIRRPVFSLLEKGPLSENCTYLSYDSLRELAGQKHLSHLADSVLEEYAEEVD